MLTVDNVTCARGGVPVLEGVSFRVAKGEALLLRGPNGSGKTTLLRVISGLQPASLGTVLVEDDQVAYGGHADGIKATLSVAENLEFWAAIYGHRDIDDALVAFDLVTLQKRAAQTLSAGQKRRLGLARLLVTGRDLWVLDEPTVSLDAASVALFASAVAGHLARGGAALIATHIDLGFDARTLDVSPFKAQAQPLPIGFDEAFA